MSDKLDFLDEPDKGSKDTTAPVTPEPAAVETPPPAQETAPVQAQPSVEVPPPGHVPLAVVLDEREKRQALAKERDELAAWKAEQLQKAQAKPPLDPIVDTDAWVAEQNARLEKLEQNLVWKDAERRALRDFGPDVVKAAFDAAMAEMLASPAFYQTIVGQHEPYEFVVKWHKRQLALAKLGDEDPDAWFEKQFEARIKERGYIAPERGPDGKFVAASPAPATQTPLPKPSLASAPAASGSAPKIPAGPGVAFDAAFKD
jgi:hypothetical protein